MISRVETASAAAKAGLEPGDIIVALNGHKIKDSYQIRNMIGLMEVGDSVYLEIVRGEDHQTVQAVIGKPQMPQLNGERLHQRLAGTVLGNTQKGQVEGVLFEKIETGSYAWRAGLRPGDILVSANRYRIRNLEELKQVVDSRRVLLINIERGGEAFFLVLK